MNDAAPTPIQIPDAPLPTPGEFGRRLYRAEPNDPEAPDGTLADVCDELARGCLALAEAASAAAAMLVHHQPEMVQGIVAFSDANSGLLKAGHSFRYAGPLLRGMMPPAPWTTPETDLPERPADADAEDGGETATADAPAAAAERPAQDAAPDADAKPKSESDDARKAQRRARPRRPPSQPAKRPRKPKGE